MNVRNNYRRWVEEDTMPEDLRQELQAMDDKQIEDAFFKDIEFGTAGMRGVLGAGTARVNIYTVRKATVAFGKYLLAKFSDTTVRGVAIAHDNRYKSREFTLDAAETLNKMGINTYIFDSLRPTPELSYAVRYLSCVGGIMITASHNPKEYNGYKIYDENGAQLVPTKLAPMLDILDEMEAAIDIKIPVSKEIGHNHVLDDKIDEAYLNEVLQIQINKDLRRDDFKIVFSPEHGAASMLGQEAFKRLGYNFIPVESQLNPDPAFSNTKTPNPEEDGAYEEAIKLAIERDADIILVTDPDGDRIGLGYKNKDGRYERFTGNESAALVLDYILMMRKQRGLLKPNSAIYTSIVTSELGNNVAKSYGVEVKLFLTGFKYIGNQVQKDINNGSAHFEFGYEESYGLLVAPFVRDKDALQALVIYSEMANYYKKQGICLDVAYELLMQKHGYFYDITYSIMFPGAEGAKNMAHMLTSLRHNPITELDEHHVVKREDYLLQYGVEGKKKYQLGTDKSDVLKYFLDNKATFAIRPSGTEPKCKFYYCVKSELSREDAKDIANHLHHEILKIIGY
ncbi:MAG TPA: phospho-sugar mutase [Bacilli bacterium]|nr:phospho-sugar mutase [Bacilli bacterium]